MFPIRELPATGVYSKIPLLREAFPADYEKYVSALLRRMPAGQTNAVQSAHFAKDARVKISTMHMGHVDDLRDFYGMKLFPRCMTDDELRNVRDLDMFEMRRRGYTRWEGN